MSKQIELTKNKFAIVDDDDYERIVMTKWYAIFNKSTQSYRAHGADGLLMHRTIMRAKKGEIVDHINHDTLDNRKENLRIVTPSQNMMNRNITKKRKFLLPKGVFKDRKKFQAIIYKDKKKYYLGVFETSHEAALAYDKKALELFGEFSKLNFENESAQ